MTQQSTAVARVGTSVRTHLGRVFIVALLLASNAVAEPRHVIDLEPATFRFGVDGTGRFTVFTVGGGWGYAWRGLTAYGGAGIGFFTFQARGGISWVPGDLNESGVVMRLEARPQVFFNPCLEPAMMGSAGVGYRWPLEEGDEYGAGTALFIMPSFEGGIAWVHRTCGGLKQTPEVPMGLIGGTIVGGLDW